MSPQPRVIQSDVCVIGGGISGATLAAKVTAERDVSVTVVEAGKQLFDLENRFAYRDRNSRYGENAWPGDFIADQDAAGIISRTMAVGGQALHWGGTVPRFSREDFRVRSLYGVGYDWPITYDDLEPYYSEGERRMGVAGEVGPVGEDFRSEPYPMKPHPLNPTLRVYREWAAKSGIPFWITPSAKNTEPFDGRAQCQRCDTCIICPTGAKYSPDFTYTQLLQAGAIELVERTLVRRLEMDPATDRIIRAHATDRTTGEELVFEADTFVVTAGYAWSSHLLLLSANDKYPAGLGNRNDLVGRFMCGHRPVTAMIAIPHRVWPGVNGYNTLTTRMFLRLAEGERYVRHDLRIFESDFQRRPRLRDDAGNLLLGQAIMDDWRSRIGTGTVRVRAYYDVIPSPESRLTLEPETRNDFGDPLPRIEMRDHDDTVALRAHTEEKINAVFQRLAEGGAGEILTTGVGRYLDHPGGGCRMGTDPSNGVVDSWGRTWDHENLFVAGAPTCVSGGCTNGTNTFVALTLRTADEVGRAYPQRGSA